MAAASWRRSMAALLERRTGPKKIALEPTLAPATKWNPVLPGQSSGPTRDNFVRSKIDPGPLPASEDEIAFAPLTKLSRWIETRKITSDRLTHIYRGLLKTVARVWNAKDIRDPAIQQKVLAHMQAAERGFRRLDAALDRVGPESLTQIRRSLKLQSIDRVDNLQTLHEIVLALEAAAQGKVVNH